MIRCPGQDQRFWKPEDITEVVCPKCGQEIEFFKDETKLKCPGCGWLLENPKTNMACLEWCQYAGQCSQATDEYTNSLREKLINQMKQFFGQDEKRIKHALKVLGFAEQILAQEGGDALVVKAAAILHDIGIKEAERKYNSSAGKYQQIEGPPIAENILKKFDIPAQAIEHICRIIANHHSAKNIDTKEFWIIWDADNIVNLPEEIETKNEEQIEKIIENRFRTRSGHQIARQLFIRTENKTV